MPNPNPQHSPTDGLDVAAKIILSGGTGASAISTIVAGREYAITLSVSAAGTYESAAALTAAIEDIKGNLYPGSLVLSAAAAASGGTTAYTGTITGGGSNAFVGVEFTVAGFTNSANNGTFVCTASSTTTLTLANASGVLETHAGTANAMVGNVSAVSLDGYTSATWYKPSNFGSYSANIASVAVSGSNDQTVTVTAHTVGNTVVEVSFPTYDSTTGTDKIYCLLNVTVIP